MHGQIIIPLTGTDRIDEVLPYLERVAQPGVKVVFLIHVGLGRFDEITRQLLAIHTGVISACSPGHAGDIDLINERLRSAEDTILAACAALRQNGTEIIVSVFSCSVRKMVREYARREEIHLVMMRGNNGNCLTRTLRRAVSRLHILRRKTLPPVLLFHPSSIAERFR